MLIHELKLNDDKTEYIIFQSKHTVRIMGRLISVCRSAYYHIWQIGKIRRSLPEDACASTVRSAMLSRMGLGGLAVTQLARLQRVQIMAARLIALKPTSESITPVLYHLHCLPVKLRNVFKMCTYMCSRVHHQ